ncbi:hypothetical protein K435DRAFT_282769 [Dendrothele bispora CBS 962.96]|uniref:MYND-type domain-containing protein n=1 Tax=Dendrothele bispora (strain CBS 962.96) TaxID=1314807 RepID=A0A4S8LLB8_DENBC|nr:hypothetical protein K435DRAFT_282769 [Dendrothele bispora CBS 962.96]
MLMLELRSDHEKLRTKWNKLITRTANIKRLRLKYKENVHQFCSRIGCPEKNPGIRKICSRCQDDVYCSAECQRLDWKEGDHRRTCNKTVEMTRTTGLPIELTDTDFHFFRWIIHNEVCDRLHEIPVQTGMFYDPTKVNMTVLDFSQSPSGFRVMPLQAYHEFLNLKSDGKVEERDLENLELAILEHGDRSCCLSGSGGDRVKVYRRYGTL